METLNVFGSSLKHSFLVNYKAKYIKTIQIAQQQYKLNFSINVKGKIQ